MSALLLIGVKSAVVLAAALLAARSKRLPAAVKHFLLVVATLSAPALALLDVVAPPTVALGAPAFELALPFASATITTDPGMAANGNPRGSAMPDVVLGSSYAVVCAALIGYWAIQVYVTFRWSRRMHRLPTELPRCQPLRRTVSLRQAPYRCSPATWGLLHPIIVVPADWQSWSPIRQQAVLAHEVAHIRRLDVLTSLLCTFIACVFWANPLIWIARRRMLVEAERACDDAVVAGGMAATTYARDLLEITRSRSPHPAAALGATARLSERIRALADTSTRRASMTVPQACTVLIGCFALVAALGGVNASPAALPAEDRTVPAMSDGVYRVLADVQDLAAASDYPSALTALHDLMAQSGPLNGNEIAQIHNMRGWIHYLADDYPAAITAYQAVLDPSDVVPRGLAVQTLYSLAQLSFATGDYHRAAEHMTAWQQQAQNPGPEPHIFLGQIHLQMRDYPEALTYVRAGIRIAEARGEPVREVWRKLEDYLASAAASGGPVVWPQATSTSSDGEYLPITKVAPIYPLVARRRQIEGYVEMEFTVSAEGRVIEPVVVDADPPGVFESAALDAVSRFRYAPRVVDGERVAVSGIRNRLAFTLDE